jgi:hypothetical protein
MRANNRDRSLRVLDSGRFLQATADALRAERERERIRRRLSIARQWLGNCKGMGFTVTEMMILF